MFRLLSEVTGSSSGTKSGSSSRNNSPEDSSLRITDYIAKNVLERLCDPYLLVSKTGVILFANEAFLELFQGGIFELAKNNLIDLFSLKDKEKCQEKFEKIISYIENGGDLKDSFAAKHLDCDDKMVDLLDSNKNEIPVTLLLSSYTVNVIADDFQLLVRVEDMRPRLTMLNDLALKDSELSKTGDELDKLIGSHEEQKKWVNYIMHEVKGPLYSVGSGFDEIFSILKKIKSFKETEEFKRISLLDELCDIASTTKAAVDQTIRVCANMLDYEKIKAGKHKIDNKPFELKELLSRIVEIARPYMLTTDVDLLFRISENGKEVKDEVLYSYNGPLEVIEQILTNLMTNAAKNTIKGKIELICEINDVDDEKSDLKFSVIDTGRGMSESRQDMLFKDFATDSIEGFGVKGHGIGMAFSHLALAKLDSKFIVNSSVGFGTNISFTLKLLRLTEIGLSELKHNPVLRFSSLRSFNSEESLGCDIKDDKLEIKDEDKVKSKESIRPEKYTDSVLLVEDNSVKMKILTKLLQKVLKRSVVGGLLESSINFDCSDIKTAIAKDDAIAKFLAHKPKIVFTDINIPSEASEATEANGIELIRFIRSQDILNATKTWIVCISATEDRKLIDKLFNIYRIDYRIKMGTKEEYHKVIDDIFKREIETNTKMFRDSFVFDENENRMCKSFPFL